MCVKHCLSLSASKKDGFVTAIKTFPGRYPVINNKR